MGNKNLPCISGVVDGMKFSGERNLTEHGHVQNVCRSSLGKFIRAGFKDFEAFSRRVGKDFFFDQHSFPLG